MLDHRMEPSAENSNEWTNIFGIFILALIWSFHGCILNFQGTKTNAWQESRQLWRTCPWMWGQWWRTLLATLDVFYSWASHKCHPVWNIDLLLDFLKIYGSFSHLPDHCTTTTEIIPLEGWVVTTSIWFHLCPPHLSRLHYILFIGHQHR